MYAVLVTWLLALGVVTGSSDSYEYCQGETFQTKCTESQSIRIRSALYGRPHVGRCAHDYGHIGCHAVVDDLLKAICDGRNYCEMDVPNEQLKAREYNCPEELASYLRVDYECYTAVVPDSHEYCQGETFQTNCTESQSIRIRSALYGRPQVGRCASRSYGYIGCHAVVDDLLKAICDGRNYCEMAVPNEELKLAETAETSRETRCPKGLVSYLQVAYECYTAVVPGRGTMTAAGEGLHGSRHRQELLAWIVMLNSIIAIVNTANKPYW